MLLTERQRGRHATIEGREQPHRSFRTAIARLLYILLVRHEVAKAEATASSLLAFFLLALAALFFLLSDRLYFLLIEHCCILLGEIDITGRAGAGCGVGRGVGGERGALVPDELDELVFKVTAGRDDVFEVV